MVRGRKARTWVKLDCEGVLRGSINYLLTLEGQAVWVKMIALSEVCGGRPGYIEDNNQNGLPDEYIAHELHCTIDLFKDVIERMKNDGAIEINGTGSVYLVNFQHYQFSEYDRQKPYRQEASKKNKEEEFLKFVESQKLEYPDLDIDKELTKFNLYWSEGSRRLQRPKTAFSNWLTKAREFKGEKESKNGAHKRRSGGIPARDSYTEPDHDPILAKRVEQEREARESKGVAGSD